MLKSTLVLWLAMVCAGIGNVWFRKGMQSSKKGYIVAGVLISIVYFFLWLVVLSWADVSWALPMNAFEYVFVTLLAIFFLKEKVAPIRWLGIGFITVGVFFMMRSW